jgi:ParB family chromosome partitioning protein
MADMGRDEAQLAVIFGCSKQTVKATLALLECAPAVQRAVEGGHGGHRRH